MRKKSEEHNIRLDIDFNKTTTVIYETITMTYFNLDKMFTYYVNDKITEKNREI